MLSLKRELRNSRVNNLILYNLSIHLISGLARIAALFSNKSKKFVEGRIGLFEELQENFKGLEDPLIWIHCASLGEFEQARPIIERFGKDFPLHKILLTFFSPSGYEVRKYYPGADFVFYLPWDTQANAKKFVAITRPALAIFVKYEFWPNFFNILHQEKILILSVSAIFRKGQIYFKTHCHFLKSVLEKVNHFFVQNQSSIDLLHSIDIKNVTLAGDTRFDRVDKLISEKQEVAIAKQFKNNENVFVIGSCWPEDLDLLAPFINDQVGKLKFIIAPHEIESSFIRKIEKDLQAQTVRYSVGEHLEESDVLIIDNVGMLSKLYQYGEYAYIGGAFGKGLHNILEAACNGIPIFFGNKNYKKFQEANDLIMRGGAFDVGDYATLNTKFQSFTQRPESYLLACDVTMAYVKENLGATEKIISHCHTLLDKE